MIAIVFVLNPNFAPYIKKYTRIIESMKLDYKIIYWDRLDSKNHNSENSVIFRYKKDLSSSKFSKISSFIKFRKFVNNELSKDYTHVILLSTLSGFLINRKNLKKYYNKIVYDIRDYTYESLPFYKYKEKKIIEKSSIVPISSNGFLNFLPKSEKYIINHNIPAEEKNDESLIRKYSDDKYPITISFVGAIRHFNIDKKLVEIFGNDNRFRLEFHGYGMTYEKLKDFISDKYNNVDITGYYSNEEKKDFYSRCDIINNYYSDEYINKYAISNKFYDSLVYKIPIWGNPNVYLGQAIKQYGLGIALRLDNNIKEKLINEFESFNYDKFQINCTKLLKEIRDEENNFELQIIKFLNE